MRTHTIAPLPFKPSRLTGLSEDLLASHYVNNYGGAVRKLNAIETELGSLDLARAPNFTINGLKREQLIASNSMILHEVYFECLGGGGGDPEQKLAEALERDFGSVQRWRDEFTSLGKALAGGSGWVLLTLSGRDGRLVNQWAADHANCLAGGTPIIALDMYEHAYHIDFGANATAYVDAFMRNLHCDRANTRFLASEQVPGASIGHSNTIDDGRIEITVEELGQRLSQIPLMDPPVIVDARLKLDYENAPDIVPGAIRGDPEDLEFWSSDLVARGKPVVVYCVYGFDVSRNTAAELRKRGLDAWVLAGGIATWKAAGGTTAKRAQ